MSTELLDPLAVIDADMPSELLENGVRIVFQCYQLAAIDCAKFPQWEKRYLQPHARRAHIEWQMRELAGQYGDRKVVASVEPNCRESADHTEIVCGRVVLTFSAVDNRDRIIRQAEFRHTLARSSQRILYLGEEYQAAMDILPASDALLYAI
jgi:hypothetical protein